jgi:hypothetical protein
MSYNQQTDDTPTSLPPPEPDGNPPEQGPVPGRPDLFARAFTALQ